MGSRKCFFLYPFSLIYRLITDVRNLLYNTSVLTSEEFSIPVICVGNITVGGTGKTPHTEYLIELLRNEYKVAVLSRGYKRKSPGFKVASVSSTVREVGDEPLQVFLKFPEIIVAVDRNRRNGIKTILKEHPETDVIILDDGFQHRRVKPGLSILLTDYKRLLTRDYLMPYGNLRERRKNRKRADVILISKTPEGIPETEITDIMKEVKWCEEQKIFFTTISYKELTPLFESPIIKRHYLSEKDPENRGAVLITGIASPDKLKVFLEKHFKEIIHLNFRDHHYFNENDIDKFKTAWKNLKTVEKILITTEKDAARLREFTNIEDSLKNAFYFIPVKVSFLKGDKDKFDNLISEYVRKNKRNNRVP